MWLVHGGFSCPRESFKQAAQSSESGAFLYLKLGNFPAGREKKGLKCSIKNAPMSPDPLFFIFLPSLVPSLAPLSIKYK